MTFRTPAGRPASCMTAANSWEVSGVRLADLSTMVQPAATAGAILRVAMASGKFHGVISRQGPTGFFVHQQPGLPVRGDRVAAERADGFLGEPAQELGAVGDLAAGLGQRLAHLQGHQQREVLGALGDQFKGPAQDLAAFTRRDLRPGLLRGSGGVQGRRCRPRDRRRRCSAAPCRWPGSSTSNVFPDAAGRHSPLISRPVGTEASSSLSRSAVTVGCAVTVTMTPSSAVGVWAGAFSSGLAINATVLPRAPEVYACAHYAVRVRLCSCTRLQRPGF